MIKKHFYGLLTLVLTLTISVSNIYAQTDTYRLKKICIDAGHGGKDPGASGKFSKEKDICLNLALKLGELINLYIPDVEVVYTRTTDVYLTLKERTVITNENKADLFISIHVNSCNSKKVKGASTYFVGEGKDNDNFRVALELQENGGEDLNALDTIEHNLHLKSYKKMSEDFANMVQKHFFSLKEKFGDTSNVKQANFAVLWRAQMPAVLIECGFISNPEEEKRLNNKVKIESYASMIYRAIKEYGYKYDDKFKAYSSQNPPQTTKQPVTQTKPQTQTTKVDIYYKVQLKSSDTKIPLTDKCFKGIKNIEEFFWDGKYKYTAGKSQDLKEITALQNEIRQKIPDAFVIAVQGGKKISLDQAKKLLGKK